MQALSGATISVLSASLQFLDNGPEFVSRALRDWCRFNNTGTGYIEPGAPWQNPFVESFNGHPRRELLEMESFNTLYEAQLLLDDCREPRQLRRFSSDADSYR
ncbi:MAG: integrase core domain-containing protein [Gaiellaceae bacterium]